jgi:hypothetical protein
MFGVPFNVDDQIIQPLESQGFFLFLVTAAILNGGLGCRTLF